MGGVTYSSNPWSTYPSSTIKTHMMSQLQEAFTQAVERASESVVSVSATSSPSRSYCGPYRRGIGSGVILDERGHILTSQHVISGGEKTIITLSNGHVLGGSVIGADEETDIAVIKVESGALKPADFGNSNELKVGQPVLAIGNPLGLAGGPTVTSGVVSSLRRNLRAGNGNSLKMIQTDAAVNPGNSGGPLLDLEGTVVAINTAMIPHAEGIGFAVPINEALEIAKQIIEHGRVQRPWLGITGYDVTQALAHRYGLSAFQGVFVVELSPDGPAEAAGLKVGDVILSIENAPVTDLRYLVELLKARRSEESIEMEVERYGKRIQIRTTLGTRPF